MTDLHIRLKRYRRRQEGQTLVLGSLALLLMAMMMLLTLNVGSAAHERIRLQSHTDAMAYSKAVEVARAFNYFAYTNRAVAGAMVSMAAIHSWMSIASLVPEIWGAGAMAWIFVGLNEIAKICMHTWCTGFQHIIHAVKAFASISPFNSERNNKRSQLRSLDSKFKDVMTQLDLQITLLRASQISVLGSAVEALALEGSWGGGQNDGLLYYNGTKIVDKNDLVGTGGLSVLNVKKAIDNSPTPGVGNNNSDSQKRARTELAEMANGSRYATVPFLGKKTLFVDWLVSRAFLEQNAAYIGVNAPLGQMRSAGKLTVQFSFVLPLDNGRTNWRPNGSGRGTFTGGSDSHNNGTSSNGLSIGSADPGGLFFMMTDCTDHGPSMGFWFYKLGGWSFIRSDSGGGNGQHDPSNTHQGSHKVNDCMKKGDCFTKFDPGTGSDYKGPADPHGTIPAIVKSEYHNQPAIYAAATLALRKLDDNSNTHQAWELNDNGNVSIPTPGSSGPVTVRLRPEGDAYAISKAMVYYHRPGEWQESPNFWNPFWRAKLHHFIRKSAVIPSPEAIEVAVAAGADATSAALTGMVTP